MGGEITGALNQMASDAAKAPELRRRLREYMANKVRIERENTRLREVALEAAHHLRNLPASKESDDIRIAEKLEAAALQQKEAQ